MEVKASILDQVYYLVKYVGFSENEVLGMPIYRRLYYLNKYKKEIEHQNQELEKTNKR